MTVQNRQGRSVDTKWNPKMTKIEIWEKSLEA